jgi:hypothetical protein
MCRSPGQRIHISGILTNGGKFSSISALMYPHLSQNERTELRQEDIGKNAHNNKENNDTPIE